MLDKPEDVAVKVAVKLRPVLQEDLVKRQQTSHAPCISVCTRSNEVIVMERHTFHFDYAFPPETTHEDLFIRCVKPILTNIFRGFNATIFAYGQTGSGKTYTMGIEDPQKVVVNRPGIIPQAVEWIFTQIESKQLKHSNSPKIRVSFVEIYQEELYDLLDQSEKVLVMRQDGNGDTVISGMKEKICTTVEEVLYFLKIGTTVRHTDSTQMNKKSSRSHSIFTFILEQSPEQKSKIIKINRRHLTSKLHFVDLAGSERAKKTGNTGKKFKESVYINSGLLALNSVINTLTKPNVKTRHIPYRQSKLTRILKDSLGGNAMALMICCISPFANDLQESISTLKYAAEARNIKNNPHMNWKELQRSAIVNEENYAEQKKKDFHTIGVQTIRNEASSNYGNVEDSCIRDILQKLMHLCINARDFIVKAFPFIKDSSKFSRKFQNWLIQWTAVQKDLKLLHIVESQSETSVSVNQDQNGEESSVDIEQAVQVLDHLAQAYRSKTTKLVKLKKKVRKIKGSLNSKVVDGKGVTRTKVIVKAKSTLLKAFEQPSDNSTPSTSSSASPRR